MELCIRCGKEPIHIKKRQLCKKCYQKLKRKEHQLFNPDKAKAPITQEKVRAKREISFIKNFFSHQEWLYEPTNFYLNDHEKYTPDFYDQKRNVFIEVIGSRQAFHSNKSKLLKFNKLFPLIELEVRTPNGELLNMDSKRISWPVSVNN